MRIAMFYHSLVSDWNHGNAHFLRGVATELIDRGHEVHVFEPADSWSRENLLKEPGGADSISRFRAAYPALRPRYYGESIDLDRELDGVDLVIVHEWNSPDLVRRIGLNRRRARFRLLFHDTHHRSVTDPDSMCAYDLSEYDGVLAFGASVAGIYLDKGWARQVWTWPRPLTRASSGRSLDWPGKVISSGLVIGATTSALPSWTSFCSAQ